MRGHNSEVSVMNNDRAQVDCKFIFADIVSFEPLTSLASTVYSMSCGPQLSGAMRKVTMCHPPLRGGDDTVPATYAYTFSPLYKRFALAWG